MKRRRHLFFLVKPPDRCDESERTICMNVEVAQEHVCSPSAAQNDQSFSRIIVLGHGEERPSIEAQKRPRRS